jgi:hypothetical protein
MNTHSTIAVRALLVAVVASLLCALSGCASAIPKGQTRFVPSDKFVEIRDCGGLLMPDGKRCYRETWATPEDCGSEPSVESVTYGTDFIGLIVPTRSVAPREKLKETLTKDGQVIGVKELEGADIYGSKSETCFVDHLLITETGALGAATEPGPLPVGRYHFELTSGTEVLSAGDITITAP